MWTLVAFALMKSLGGGACVVYYRDCSRGSLCWFVQLSFVHWTSMGRLCDFCMEQRSVVYCRSDAASLCLSCDRNIHSANALSRRHSRTLLCDRCATQPAIVRCIEENASLCQNCDWNGHGGLALTSEHKRQTINCYSGCPSAAEFSRIWSFFEFPDMEEPDFEKGLMTINENSVTNCWGPPEDSSTANLGSTGKMNDIKAVDKANPWVESSSASGLNAMSCSADRPAGSMDSTTPKVHQIFLVHISSFKIWIYCDANLLYFFVECKLLCFLMELLYTIWE